MPCEKLESGTRGNISASKQANGRWRARARYCDLLGQTGTATAVGPTKSAAKDNVQDKLDAILVQTVVASVTAVGELCRDWYNRGLSRAPAKRSAHSPRLTGSSRTSSFSWLHEPGRNLPQATVDRVIGHLARLNVTSTYWPGDEEVRQTLATEAAYRRFPRACLRMFLEAAENHYRAETGQPQVERKAYPIEHLDNGDTRDRCTARGPGFTVTLSGDDGTEEALVEAFGHLRPMSDAAFYREARRYVEFYPG